MCTSVVACNISTVGPGFDTSTLGLVKTLLSVFKAGRKKMVQAFELSPDPSKGKRHSAHGIFCLG